MPCALTQGYVIDCKDSLGGIVEVYFMALNDVSTYTASGGVITALTKVTGKRFYKYQLVKSTAGFTETMNGSIENGTIFFQQELNIVLNKLAVNTRNEILLLAKNVLVAVAKDGNGNYWGLGWTRGLDVTAGVSQSGVAEGDRNGYTMTFTGKEKELAYQISSTVAAALETAG
jgi:hypothetical protein